MPGWGWNERHSNWVSKIGYSKVSTLLDQQWKYGSAMKCSWWTLLKVNILRMHILPKKSVYTPEKKFPERDHVKKEHIFSNHHYFRGQLSFLRCKSQIFLELFIIFHQLLWTKLVGGFNPSEKYSSNWIISPRIGVKIKNMDETTTQQRSVPFPYSSLPFGVETLWRIITVTRYPCHGVSGVVVASPARPTSVMGFCSLFHELIAHFTCSWVLKPWHFMMVVSFYIMNSGMHQIHETNHLDNEVSSAFLLEASHGMSRS